MRPERLLLTISNWCNFGQVTFADLINLLINW